jgi:hypothetical protein
VTELRESRQEVAVLQEEWGSFRQALAEQSAQAAGTPSDDRASAPHVDAQGRNGEQG